MFNVTLNGSGTSVYWLRRKQSCPSALGTSEHGRGSKLYFQNLSGEITQNAEWHMGWCPNRPKECGGLKGILGHFFFLTHPHHAQGMSSEVRSPEDFCCTHGEGYES